MAPHSSGGCGSAPSRPDRRRSLTSGGGHPRTRRAGQLRVGPGAARGLARPVHRVVPRRRPRRGHRLRADPRPGQPQRLRARRAARRALRPGPARPGQVRLLPGRQGARRRRRHPGRLPDVRRPRLGGPRQRGAAGGLPGRGARPRLRVAGRQQLGHLPGVLRLLPGPRVRHRPDGPRARPALADRPRVRVLRQGPGGPDPRRGEGAGPAADHGAVRRPLRRAAAAAA